MLRRSFVAGLAALIAAPAVVKAADLMQLPRRPVLWGDGLHDDTAALQWVLDNAPDGRVRIPPGTYKTTAGLVVRKNVLMLNGLNSKIMRVGPRTDPGITFAEVPQGAELHVRNLWIDTQQSRAECGLLVQACDDREARMPIRGNCESAPRGFISRLSGRVSGPT